MRTIIMMDIMRAIAVAEREMQAAALIAMRSARIAMARTRISRTRIAIRNAVVITIRRSGRG
jgi:hypothetical protein